MEEKQNERGEKKLALLSTLNLNSLQGREGKMEGCIQECAHRVIPQIGICAKKDILSHNIKSCCSKCKKLVQLLLLK